MGTTNRIDLTVLGAGKDPNGQEYAARSLFQLLVELAVRNLEGLARWMDGAGDQPQRQGKHVRLQRLEPCWVRTKSVLRGSLLAGAAVAVKVVREVTAGMEGR